MSITTRAKVNMFEGIIELEGTEEFVSKYLDEFKSKLDRKENITATHVKSEQKRPKSKKKIKENTHSISKKRTPKKIEIEEFDINSDSKGKAPSLKDFLDDKKATDSPPKTILAVGYYITHFKKASEFSEGNIEFTYKALRLTGRPLHLHQTIINKKNKEVWFEQGSDSNHWKLSRIGELFVEESMPEKAEVK
jgi:hypothetical protein